MYTGMVWIIHTESLEIGRKYNPNPKHTHDRKTGIDAKYIALKLAF